MLQVSYVSQTAQPMQCSELLDLLLQCREYNGENGITGMLLYGNSTFLQVIEGEDGVINSLVNKIEADPRHNQIEMLSRKEINDRDYASWTMGFEQISDEDIGNIEGLRNFESNDFTVEYLSGHGPVVDKLLQHYREPHWDQVIGEFEAKDKVIRHLEGALNQARDQARIARLALESITETAKQGAPSEAVLRICEATLKTMRNRPEQG